MSFETIEPWKARQVPGREIYSFRRDGKITLKPGYYYAVIANSPPSGIVMSKQRFPGSEPVGEDANYRIGRVTESSDTLVFYYPYER